MTVDLMSTELWLRLEPETDPTCGEKWHSSPESTPRVYCKHHRRGCLSSDFNIVVSLPDKQTRNNQAKSCPSQVELDDGPDPKAAEGRGLLQNRQVAVLVGDMYQGAACDDARREEYDLSEGILEAGGDERGR